MAPRCPMCDGPMPPASPTGRPAAYCSSSCHDAVPKIVADGVTRRMTVDELLAVKAKGRREMTMLNRLLEEDPT